MGGCRKGRNHWNMDPWSSGAYHMRFMLPDNCSKQKVTAELRNGLLLAVVPKTKTGSQVRNVKTAGSLLPLINLHRIGNKDPPPFRKGPSYQPPPLSRELSPAFDACVGDLFFHPSW
ncbi:hypothetical protein GW17_00053331 [Ensete ventricosum]|nr:hypothetical protein GW17_00053331 [Ensete ventricosum]